MLPESKAIKVLELLMDWLLGDSISFRQLDVFRQKLQVETETMARLLGVSPGTYKGWRASKTVPFKRDRMHGVVSSYLPVGSASQTGQKKAVRGGLARSLCGFEVRPRHMVLTPSRTTPKNVLLTWDLAPHLYMPL